MVANVRPLRVIGRYLIAEPIAAGGMATVYLGRLAIAEGDQAKALNLLNSVVAMEGATEKAKQEARGLLNTISKEQ